MPGAFKLVEPRFAPLLDAAFRPAVLANRAFLKEVKESAAGVPLVLGLERGDGSVSRFETEVFPEGHPRAAANLEYAERLLKFLLWQRGGWRVYVGGPRSIGVYLAKTYAPDGDRKYRQELLTSLNRRIGQFHDEGQSPWREHFRRAAELLRGNN